MHNLVFFIYILSAAILSAFGRRMVGGLLSQWCKTDLGNLPPRIIWGVIIGNIAWYSGATWWQQLACIPLVVAGCSVGFWGSMSAGNQPGRTILMDWLLLTVHGVGATILLAIAAYYVGLVWWPMVIAGLACAPCYAFAWIYPLQAPWLGCYKVDPPPTAELLWGACVGVAAALA